MTEIKLLPASDYAAYIEIAAKAYPGMNLDSAEALERATERIKRAQEEAPLASVWGAYRDGALQGGMIFYDFAMTWHTAQVQTGGVGMVAVDLLHKKEKVARDMIRFFIAHYTAQGAPLTSLYPFRPDFYKQMGFGWGPKMRQYRFVADALPRGAHKDRLRYLTPDDAEAVMACYDAYRERTHGMMVRRVNWAERALKPGNVFVGYEDAQGELRGYLSHTFEKSPTAGGNFLKNDLIVHDWIALDREAQLAFCAYLHTQADQAHRIIYTTHDDSLQHLLTDPRSDADNMIPSVYHESNVAGVGLMYRIGDVPGVFRALRDHNFGGQTLRLKLDVQDSFMPDNAGPTVVHFSGGQATLVENGEADVTLALDISDLSSIMMGVVPVSTLYHYGVVEVSDPATLPALDALFRAASGPVCMTHF